MVVAALASLSCALIPTPTPEKHDLVVVSRVIYGDTIRLASGEKVRLIGVDTPDTKHPRSPLEPLGRQATEFTRRLLKDKRVWLEYDRQRRDRYGRTLAYVYLEDGTFLNAEILRRGYGFAYTRYPCRHADRFHALEREAREGRRGLWAGND